MVWINGVYKERCRWVAYVYVPVILAEGLDEEFSELFLVEVARFEGFF